MISCIFLEQNQVCKLLSTLRGISVHVPQEWCNMCQTESQIAMLKRRKIVLPDPKGKDLLEWAKECVAKGTVKMPPQAIERQKQKEEYEKIIAELPSRALQFEHLRKHAVEIAKYKLETGRVFVSGEWKAARLKLGCEECDKLRVNPKTSKWWCGCCGCNVVGLVGDKIGKADFEALTCGPWKEIDAAFLAKLESDSEDKAAGLKGV
jgi:hypothetical protein